MTWSVNFNNTAAVFKQTNYYRSTVNFTTKLYFDVTGYTQVFPLSNNTIDMGSSDMLIISSNATTPTVVLFSINAFDGTVSSRSAHLVTSIIFLGLLLLSLTLF